MMGSGYDVAIKNIGKIEITDAHVSYNGFKSVGGYIAPGTDSVHMNVQIPLPNEVNIQWRSKNGVMHNKIVSLKNHKKKFKGKISFLIDDNNNVEVVVVEAP